MLPTSTSPMAHFRCLKRLLFSLQISTWNFKSAEKAMIGSFQVFSKNLKQLVVGVSLCEKRILAHKTQDSERLNRFCLNAQRLGTHEPFIHMHNRKTTALRYKRKKPLPMPIRLRRLLFGKRYGPQWGGKTEQLIQAHSVQKQYCRFLWLWTRALHCICPSKLPVERIPITMFTVRCISIGEGWPYPWPNWWIIDAQDRSCRSNTARM